MIEGIGGGYAGFAPRPHMAALSADQKQQVTDLLSRYDANTLSKGDARSLVDQFKDLGIPPGRDLALTLADQGFDAHKIASQAGLGIANAGPTAPPQNAAAAAYTGDPAGVTGPNTIATARTSVDDRVLDLISEVMDNLNEAEDDSATFAERLAQRLEEEGYDSTAPIMDFYA